MPVLIVLVLAACTPGQTAAGSTATLPPPTEQDPPPYAPPPSSSVGRTGDTTSLTADAGYEPARAVAVSFLRALFEADRGEISSLLVDSVVVGRQGRQTMTRATFVQEALRHREQQPVPQLVTFDQVVEPQRVGIRAMSAYAVEYPWVANIGAFSDGDVVVVVPLRVMGRRLFHPWNGRSAAEIVIRPGLEPRIVGVL